VRAVEYLKQVLEAEGIPVKIFALDRDSDQERILKTELHWFGRMHWDAVVALAAAAK
jgi:hypothetical protein